MEHIWEKPLTKPQKHLALYAKGHYEEGDNLYEDVRTIYSMNKGGVPTDKTFYVLRFVYKTWLKLSGPDRHVEEIPRALSKLLYSDLGPDNIWRALLSRIGGTVVNYDTDHQNDVLNGEYPDWAPEEERPNRLEDVEPRRIKSINGNVVEPSN